MNAVFDGLIKRRADIPRLIAWITFRSKAKAHLQKAAVSTKQQPRAQKQNPDDPERSSGFPALQA